MFDLVKYIKEKMVNCVKKGIFDTDYAGIMAVNYLAKGLLVKEDVASIDAQITAWEAEQIVKEEPAEEIPPEEVNEPTDEVIEEPVEDTGEATETARNEIEPEPEQIEPENEENEPENMETETDPEETEPVE